MNEKKNKILVAKNSDIREIMNFINSYWKKNHILARDKKFFLFQHSNRKKLNFIISKNKKNKINGIIGFIKASKNNNSDVWTSTWKVLKNSIDPMLGVRLLEFIKKLGYRSIMSAGINIDTIGIYKYLGYSTGKLDHFFLPNKKFIHNKIGIIPKKLKDLNFVPRKNKKYNIFKISSKNLKEKFSFSSYRLRIPFKDWNYFNSRYFLHPNFKYQIYGIFLKKKLISIIVMRDVSKKSSSILRIIDYYGEETPFKYLSDFFNSLIIVNDYEYIDLLCYGMKKKIIESAGFIEVPIKSKKIVIPNYFDPFLKKNIPIYFYVNKKLNSNLRIFKGDGDQDRPN